MGVGAWEGKDALYEYGFIRDPVKMINVYSVGYCDMLGPTMAGIMSDMGVGPARTVNIPGWGHVVAEVSYDGKWHYVDLDVRACFRRDDGTLASVEESKHEPALWQGPNNPRFFPLDNLASTRSAYEKSNLSYRYGVNSGGHTMDYVLRRGETLTRWWKPQGDHWNHHETYEKNMRAVLEREPKGPKCKHGDAFTIHTRGEGRFVYKPDLTNALDVEDGLYDSANVKATPAGLKTERAGEGYCVFEVRSPYVIAPSVGKYETKEDDKDASVVKIDGENLKYSISMDNGLTWTELGAEKTLDLTKYVSGTYGYLLKIALKPESVVRALEFTTWMQAHPAALPSLRKGKNEMRFVTGDHYGLQSRIVEIRTNGSDREDFLKYLVEPPKDFDPNRKLMRLKGTCVAKVSAPPGTKITWFSGGGAFCAQQGDAAPKTANAMAWAVGAPNDFKTFYKADVPVGQAHWFYNADVEVKLEQAAEKLFIQYTGDPGVNNLRIYAHCLDEKKFAPAKVNITHAWSEKGVAKTKTVSVDSQNSKYVIECADDPTDEMIEMSVPSAGR
jgi:hypothetical protein